jgi:hypothetical protein
VVIRDEDMAVEIVMGAMMVMKARNPPQSGERDQSDI